MKSFTLVACVLILAPLGCQPGMPADSRDANRWLMNTVTDTSVRNAIIRQRTLFAFHFVTGGAALTSFGEHELAVLAAHFRDNPGELSIRRGNASDQLYQARVATVIDMLGKTGVDRTRVTISDSPAQGEGMASEHVLVILRQQTGPQPGYQQPVIVVPARGE